MKRGRAVEGTRQEQKAGVKGSFPPQGKQPGKIIVARRQRKATNDSGQYKRLPSQRDENTAPGIELRLGIDGD